MNQINVSLDQILETAEHLQKINIQLTSCLDEMLSLMNQLDGSWESETSLAIRMKFSALSPHFEQYARVIDSYAAFLAQTAENYQMTETALRQNAESFQ